MLKGAADLCRSVVFRGGLEPLLDVSGTIHVQYAACSVVKAFTANLNGVARVTAQQQRQLAVSAAAAGGADGGGIVIHESAVRVSTPSLGLAQDMIF
jgi:hypothetical protein